MNMEAPKVKRLPAGDLKTGQSVWLAGIRFLGLALLLSPFLRPFPKQFGLVFAIAMCIGGDVKDCDFIGSDL